MKETIDQLILDIVRRSERNIAEISSDHSLRTDLGFDSFDLAELTVRIEDRFGVDIFEKSTSVDKVSEVYEIVGA